MSANERSASRTEAVLALTSRAPNVRRNRFVFALLTIGLVWLLMADRLSGLPVTDRFSINLLVTSLFAIGIAAVVLLSSRWKIAVAILLLLLLGLTSNLVSDYSLASAQYLLTIGCFAFAASMKLEESVAIRIPSFAYAISLMSAVLLSITSLLDLPWANRAGQSVTPILVLILLVFGTQFGGRFIVLGFVASMGLLASMTIETSRMATLLNLTLILGWLVFACPWKAYLRVALIAMITSGQALFWTFHPWAVQRLTGRDASIDLGVVQINGEGRTAAAAVALKNVDFSVSNLMVGQGVGATQFNLESEGFHLDKPHNDYLRLFLDVGLLGLLIWLGIIAAIAILGLRSLRSNHHSPKGQIALGVALTLSAYSISDNPLSYSWLLIPAGILIAWARTPASDLALQADGDADTKPECSRRHGA